jgi:PAS domain S-box-containing protein
MPMAEVDAGHSALLWRSLGLGGLALAMASVLIWRIGAGIARPIDALAAEAAAAAGGPPAMPPGTGRSEVATAAADLHRLADERLQLQSQHARLSASYRQLVEAARDIVLLVDPQGRIVQANGAALAAYGYSAEELQAMTVGELRAPDARALTERDFRAAARPEGVLFETVHQRKDGSRLPVEVSSHVIDIEGEPFRQSFIRDISARQRDEALLRGQSAVLAQVAQGAPLAATLDALARLVEAQSPGLVATILLLDDDRLHLRHGAAPSLPRGFVDAIDGAAIGPQAGACGTAVFRRAPVLSEDIATDARWDDWRVLALAHGLHACWSTPILDGAGQVLGTFALYFRQPGPPEAGHQRLVDLVTHTAAIAIVGARSSRTQGAQLDELLRWQALMVDREARMRALKAEVDALRARLGEPARYAEGEPR